MRYVVNKLVTENEKVVGYRVNTLDWKFDLDIGSMRKLFSVVGKSNFRSGENIYVTMRNGIYCSDNETGVVECLDWINLASRLTLDSLGGEVPLGVQRKDISELVWYRENGYDVNKIIRDLRKEMDGCYGSMVVDPESDGYDVIVQIDHHFLRFIDLSRFIVNYVRCHWSRLAPRVRLEIKVGDSVSRCVVTDNTTVEEVALAFAKVSSDNVLYSDNIRQMSENYEISVKLLGNREDKVYSVVEIDEGLSGDLVVTDFKKFDNTRKLNLN